MSNPFGSIPLSTQPDCLLDYNGILKLLPHRYPFLLIDKVLRIEDENIVVAQKNVTFNEPFFQGHFPSEPVMPGVLIVEAMAQAGALLLFVVDKTAFEAQKRPAFTAIDACRFRKPVRPGDVLIFKAHLLQYRRGMGKLEVKVYNQREELVAEANIMATMV
jgi:beta-hydroxyacyl-ACP dehydratase FabZ